MSGASALRSLILASASPRREQLLREAGYVFQIDPADIDESDHAPNLAPAVLAQFLAVRKAEVVAVRHPDAVVLSADTVVAIDSEILGKPIDAVDARRMLRRLGGSTHEVITGIAIAHRASNLNDSACVVSAVQMRVLSEAEVEAYVASGGWRGKAGGYGIQDPDPFVTRMSGSLTNIVGLPMDETSALLSRAGIVPRHSPEA